jgi:hypothetical protein
MIAALKKSAAIIAIVAAAVLFAAGPVSIAPVNAGACTCADKRTSDQPNDAACASYCASGGAGNGGDTFGSGLLKDVGGQAKLNTAQTPEGYVSILVNAAFAILGVIFLILMVYGGYLWLQARGNEESVSHAKSTISNAIIGLIIVLGAYAISVFIVSRIFAAAT